MKGKRLLGVALAVSSLALLVVAASTAAPAAKRGGTFVFEISTDVDYIDPQLSYYGETWKLEAATACKLMNWPDKEGAAGAVATPEVAAGLPVVSRDEIGVLTESFNQMARSLREAPQLTLTTAIDVTESFDAVANPLPVRLFERLIWPNRQQDVIDGMRTTLERLKVVAEG